MGIRLLKRLGPIAALATALAVVLASPAAAHGPTDVHFDDGSILGLWEDDARTQAVFDNLHYEFDECGQFDNELTCTWSVEVVLHTGSEDGCPAAPEEATVVWDSGERSGNGSVDSGPQEIAFPPCASHALTVSYGYEKTYRPWEGEGPAPYLPLSGGGSFTLLPVGIVEETKRNISEASPPAHPGAAPTVPALLRTSPDCRSLFFGDTRYAFRFARIGCWKARNLVARSWDGASPAGFLCNFGKAGQSGRCVSTRDPKKLYAWHLPRKRAAKA